MMNFAGRPAPVSKNDGFCIKHVEFCIKNEELCIENEELCIENDELCRPVYIPQLSSMAMWDTNFKFAFFLGSADLLFCVFVLPECVLNT